MRKALVVLVVVCLAVAFVGAGRATLRAFSLSWWKAGAGGGETQGGDYSLRVTAGQAEAGTLRGGNYTLASGFWSEAPSVPYQPWRRVLLPLIVK